MNSIIILGGRSQITPFLLQKLYDLGHEDVTVTSRRATRQPHGYKSLILDLKNPNGWEAPKGSIIISLIPIWIFKNHLPLFGKAKEIIAISSTSRFGKANTKNREEQHIVQGIIDGEQKIKEWTTPNGPTTTILRPTLIYDGENDKNITRIIKTIKKLSFLPVASPCTGKRQPIHAADVAGAIIGALGNKEAANRAFNIAGGEILTYQDMVIRLFNKIDQEPKFFMMPMWFIRSTMFFVGIFNFIHKLNINADVFERMNEDLIFDNKEGLKVLNYKPRKFLAD